MRSRIAAVTALFLAIALLSCGPFAPSPTPTPLPPPTPVEPASAPTPSPSTTPEPELTATPSPSPTQTPPPPPPPQPIVLDIPQSGATIHNPVEVRGRVRTTPFEANLRGRVYDADGEVIGEGPIRVVGELGEAGTFAALIPFSAGSGGPGRVEVAEISAKDGSVVNSAVVQVTVGTGPSPDRIELPLSDTEVALPLHLLARVGRPNDRIAAVLRWQDGTELAQEFTALEGEDGKGLLVGNMNWSMEGPPPQPPTQSAELQLRDQDGRVLVQKQLTILRLTEANSMLIDVFWVLGEDLVPAQRRIPRTLAVGTAALEELLWGPVPPNLAGFATALPTPEEVLDYPGREEGWGPRVTLRGLVIRDGVATADFSKEMAAYGGGSLRVQRIRGQITETLQQFATVSEVVIAVEGETEGVLQP